MPPKLELAIGRPTENASFLGCLFERTLKPLKPKKKSKKKSEICVAPQFFENVQLISLDLGDTKGHATHARS